MPIYMNYAGINEDGQSASHTDWIEISSFQWGIGRQISSSTGGSADRESSAPSVSEIVVTKKTDEASASLYNECLVGTPLSVSIILTNTPKPDGPHHKIDLENAVITHIQPHPTRSGKGEKLTITFSEYAFNGLKNIPVPYTIFHP